MIPDIYCFEKGELHVPYNVNCANSHLGELNDALTDNAGSAILDNGIT